MIAEPLSDYFGVGARFVFLREARPGIPVEGKGYVDHVITLFFKDIEKFQFNITKNVLGDLSKFQKEIRQNGNDYKLSQEDVNKLHEIMASLQKTYEAESHSIWTLAFKEKRFPLNTLLQQIDKLFGHGVFDKLPELAKHDLSEAGKCIAMERATAGAFHILRATEAIIKDLYLVVVKRNRLKKPMWHGMVEAMKNKKRNPPNEALLDQLQSIRKHYRNPTQHPEKVYSMDEVQDLLSSSVAVVNMMAQEKCKYAKDS